MSTRTSSCAHAGSTSARSTSASIASAQFAAEDKTIQRIRSFGGSTKIEKRTSRSHGSQHGGHRDLTEAAARSRFRPRRRACPLIIRWPARALRVYLLSLSLTHTPWPQQRGARGRRHFDPSKYPCAARPTRRSAPVRRPARISRNCFTPPPFLFVNTA